MPSHCKPIQYEIKSTLLLSGIETTQWKLELYETHELIEEVSIWIDDDVSAAGMKEILKGVCRIRRMTSLL